MGMIIRYSVVARGEAKWSPSDCPVMDCTRRVEQKRCRQMSILAADNSDEWFEPRGYILSPGWLVEEDKTSAGRWKHTTVFGKHMMWCRTKKMRFSALIFWSFSGAFLSARVGRWTRFQKIARILGQKILPWSRKTRVLYTKNEVEISDKSAPSRHSIFVSNHLKGGKELHVKSILSTTENRTEKSLFGQFWPHSVRRGQKSSFCLIFHFFDAKIPAVFY